MKTPREYAELLSEEDAEGFYTLDIKRSEVEALVETVIRDTLEAAAAKFEHLFETHVILELDLRPPSSLPGLRGFPHRPSMSPERLAQIIREMK